jgi:hypothetical protein
MDQHWDEKSGTAFYLFSLFTGSILTDVPGRLRKESAEGAAQNMLSWAMFARAGRSDLAEDERMTGNGEDYPISNLHECIIRARCGTSSL